MELNNEHIYDLGSKLRKLGVDLEEEGDAAGFLGVDLVRYQEGQIHMKQPGLINRIISALGFKKEETTVKDTLAEQKPLTKDKDGPAAHKSFSCASIVGMLLYISGHS